MLDGAINDTQATGASLTVAYMSGVELVNADIAKTAAGISEKIPYLSAILTGLFGAIIHVAGGMMANAQSAAQATAQEKATGNINIGNTQQDGHSYNNTHANKMDTSGFLPVQGIPPLWIITVIESPELHQEIQ